MKPIISMRRALADKGTLGEALGGDSWSTWRTFLIAAAGERLSPDEEATFRKFTGDRAPPTVMPREQVYVIGRRGGKDHAISLLAVWLAALHEHPALARGERGTLLVIAPDTAQAQIQLGYIRGALESSPLLSSRIIGQTADSISLDNGIDLTVRSSSFRRLRGLTCVGIVASEVAFWLSENSSNPDSEILRAVRPSLLTTGGPLVMISTPYSRRGEIWSAYEKHFGKDSSVLVVQGASSAFNPTLPAADIAAAYEADPEAAAAEYGGLFRSDISAFISRDAVMACVNASVKEIGHRGHRCFAFVDPSGGRADSMTLCIAHQEDGRVIIDLLAERVPPFSPDDVVREFASELRRYRITSVTGDRYGAEWTVEAFRKADIRYEPSDLASSDLFRELVPVLNTRSILLLDNARAIGQICALERRTGRSGKDISHPPGGHDDLAVAVAGAAYLAGGIGQKRGHTATGFVSIVDGSVTWPRKGRNILSPEFNGGEPTGVHKPRGSASFYKI